MEYTKEFPDALKKYKSSISLLSNPPLNHEQLASGLDVPRPNFDQLLEDVKRIPHGNASATLYHHTVEKLLTALFYPYLGNMRLEREIHQGRNRIDIVYDNLSTMGTFYWLGSQFTAREVPVECKNYEKDIANPELDQIAGRLSDRRGWVGFVVCRRFVDKGLFLERCKDTALDGRGFIVLLDDADLEELVRERKLAIPLKPREQAVYKLIRERVDLLIR